MLQRLSMGIVLLFLAVATAQAAAAGYPKEIAREVALYPGGQVVQQTSEENGIQVVLSVSGTVDKVAAYYKKEMPKSGWKQENFQEMGPAQAIGFVKGKRHAVITIMQVADQLTATIGIDR